MSTDLFLPAADPRVWVVMAVILAAVALIAAVGVLYASRIPTVQPDLTDPDDDWSWWDDVPREEQS